MGKIFEDDLLDSFGTWALAYIPFGGPDYGEIAAIGQAVGSGGPDAFYEQWSAAGDRAMREARIALVKNHTESARELFLKASVFYGSSYHPLFGKPLDPRLVTAYRKQIDAMNRGFELFNPVIRPLSIPFEGSSMPAYLIPAQGKEKETRPLIIFTDGYDATVTDLYFGAAVAASRRGYHSLIFDGPGQGGMLFEQKVPIRPDWETVITAVIDFISNNPAVDTDRIALSGWSFGGYLAPRAASAEHRIAACIADPGVFSIADGFRGLVGDSKSLDSLQIDHLSDLIMKNPMLQWKIVNRGFWVHGVDYLIDYFRSAESFTLEGRIESIQCPTLLTKAEGDPLAASVESMFDQLRCPKTLLRFSAIEGAGGHCEMGNRSALNRRVFDWLDEVFAKKAVATQRPRLLG